MKHSVGTAAGRPRLAGSVAALVVASVILAAGGVGLHAFSAASRALARERAEHRAALAEAKTALALSLLEAHAEAATLAAAAPAVRALLAPTRLASEGASGSGGAPASPPAADAPSAPPAPGHAARAATEALEALLPSTPFEHLALLDASGERLAVTGGGPGAAALARVERAHDRARRSNLRVERGGRARYDLAVPLREGNAVGYLVAVVRADALWDVLVARARLSDEDAARAPAPPELEALGALPHEAPADGPEPSDSLASPMRDAVVGTLALAVVALAIALVVVRRFTSPLALAATAAARLAEGDLRDPPGAAAATRDELEVALSSLRARLRAELDRLGAAAAELDRRAAEVASASTKQVTAASARAAAVTSTSASLVETKKSSAVTASTARSVLEATEAAVAAGRRGLDRIEDGAAAMGAIEDRVRIIAREALELSRQSTQIGQIVATVNDLSEQSNVLAVNASVEAAKAGERGRGFAVVATEVRRLAEQSKRATQQIRQILGEVQRAVEGVVMAAEEGTKRSEDGLRSIAEIRATIHELASALEQNADGARRISASAAEQAAGIAHLTGALESVGENGDAAARDARALEASAAALGALVAELRALAGRYRA